MIFYFEAWRARDSTLENFFQGPQDLHNEFEGYKKDRYHTILGPTLNRLLKMGGSLD